MLVNVIESEPYRLEGRNM